MNYWRKICSVALMGALIVVSGRAAVLAQSSSTNYQVDEFHFGTGGEIDSASPNYRGDLSTGENVVGDAEGDEGEVQATTGSNTPSEPVLEMTINGGGHNFGTVNSSTTVYGDTDVTVRSYLSSGYVMQVTGSPPRTEAHTIAGMASPDTAQTNVEQFGINLRDNSLPNVGADPVQLPDDTFSYGVPTADYDTPDSYKYVDGDVIAQSSRSTGETRYTLSLIMNVSNLTPAGSYSTDISVVVVSTF